MISPRPPLPGEIATLEAQAASWVGTPFCANSAVRGAGVSCHRLMSEIYVGAGWLPQSLVIPDGPTGWARAQTRSLIADWLDGSPHFARLAHPAGAIFPGDLVGFRLGCCVHHLAMRLPRGRLIHSLEGHGVCVVDEIPKPWARRLAAAWRLILP